MLTRLLPALLAAATLHGSEMREALERYRADRESLERRYPIEASGARLERFAKFYQGWRADLEKMPFEKWNQESRIDFLLFRNHLEHEIRGVASVQKKIAEAKKYLPFLDTVLGLEEARQRMEFVEGEKAAAALESIRKSISETRRGLDGRGDADRSGKLVANRASRLIRELRDALKSWNAFYSGYDPLFTWWVGQPYKALDSELGQYAAFLRERIVGVSRTDRDTIIGDPIGAESLLSDLDFEMLPYKPEELVEIANREFAWCDGEMLKASRELGYGDDWKKALEHVKKLYMPPGKQPELVRQLGEEGIRYMDDHDLITVPPLARETWRMQMMSPERQRINPFFLGGEVLRLSYPTDTMTHEQKMMSMRGNNIHFSRATVFHELIPGHHLQAFMNQRHRTWRRVFRTPFSTEGWALYWEMLLWDMGFHKSPESRVGALFWRMHRCARIIFSLNFHLGKMTAQQAIDFLVDRVGHERDNAVAEVRRSVEDDSYSPLYQCAYMLGALQFRALAKEFVGSGKMKNREFHDRILAEHNMPVEMVRAALTGTPLTRNFKPSWRFYDQLK